MNKKDNIDVDEHELIYMIRQKDDIAIRMLMKAVEGRANQIIARYYSPITRMDKSDYMQIAMVKLLRAIEEYREDRETSFLYYYDRILRHTFMDMKRVSKRSVVTYSMEYAYEKHLMDKQGNYHVSPLQSNEELHNFHMLAARSINELNRKERQIAIMRLQGYSYREISDRLSVSVKKVDNTLRKLRHKKIN